MRLRRIIAVWLTCLPAVAGELGYSFETQWGGFGQGPGQFRYPTMIAVDAKSAVYVVDQHNHRVQKFDARGTYVTGWGEFGDGPGQFNYPYGVAVDSQGAVYVSDMDNHRIQKFSPDGKFLRSAGSHGAGNGQFKHPYGIAAGPDDTLYVIDSLNYRLQKFDRNLNFLGAWGSEESIGVKLYMPHEIAVSASGNVLLSDRQNHRISEFTPAGRLVRRFGAFGEMRAPAEDASDAGMLSEPHGVAARPDGVVLVADRYNYRVQEFAPNGKYRGVLHPRGPHSDAGQFVLGIALDREGNVYVTDHYQHCVMKYRKYPGWAGSATEFGAPGRTRR